MARARRAAAVVPADVGALTTAEAARYLRIDRHALYTAVELGHIRCYGGKGGYVFPRREVEAYMERLMSEREERRDNVRSLRP